MTKIRVEPNKTIKEYANDELDRAYMGTAGKMLTQVAAISKNPNSKMQRKLYELDGHAKAKIEIDEKIAIDDPYLTNALVAYDENLVTTQSMITAVDNSVQLSGTEIAGIAVVAKVLRSVATTAVSQGINPVSVRALSLYKAAISDSAITWTFLSPDAVSLLTDYVDSEAWIHKMEGWGKGYYNITRDSLIDGISKGWSPVKTASVMRQYAEGIPLHAAENLTRTLQLTSYRDAERACAVANGKYLEYKIRIARLDGRTCLACLALHGTQLRIDERVDDHYRGRCDVWYKTLGGPDHPEFMQADSRPGKRNFTEWKTGDEWFASLSEERQAMQNSFKGSPAKMRAYRSGVPLKEFVGDHVDDVFGNQVIEKSLRDTVGDTRASDFYSYPKAETS